MIGNVVGNYRIERELGEGGMSHVYVGRTVARSEILPEGYEVVLKVINEELAGEVTARKRFVKEALILEKLRHRYITRFYEFINKSDSAVLVMELVEGTPVDVLLTERGALPIADAIGTAQCLLEALVYAHGKGIVHRDIKPANLIREKAGVVKVTDFGIAKIKEGGTGSTQTVLTKSGFLLGTPHYMSPEQIREPKDAGAKSDVYSTGVVLYEMLTGSLPFNSRSLPKLIDAIYRGEKQPPRALRPEIDAELEAIVMRAMHPRMEQRYESARAFFEALEEYNLRPGYTPTMRPLPAAQMPAGKASAPQQWQLVHVKPEANEKHSLQGDSIMVGRDRTCSVVLTHPAVSRRHARITMSGGSCMLEDLKSANGTYVNNTRVEKIALKPGDVVRFGADPACSYVLRSQ
ncbi:MAG TPA: FHA domain-containing serine/threonine-protein kinase [Thermoanaerobaculia bacterium]|jgi:serine/threonine-protein kinase|nr:FHA domain-containing serine/threonine-protein kinase [Thermoanaerobaculia bacterium]